MHEQSDILQHADPLTQIEPKTVSSAKGCLSVNFPIWSVCQKLVVHNQHLPITALTSFVRENVDLTKYQLKSPRVKSGCLKR